jgi:hypothetical protein
MKKAYEEAAKFVRWVVVGLMAFLVALPAFTSIGAST